MRRAIILAAVFAVTLRAQGAQPGVKQCGGKKLLTDLPLRWVPTSKIIPDAAVVTIPPGVEVDPHSGLPATLKVEVAPLEDARESTRRIGENHEDLRNFGCIWPVATKDDVAAWTTDHLRFLLRELGIHVVESGGELRLVGKLINFYVSEGATYEGSVRLKLDLETPAGEAVWSGVVNGANVRWGRSYKLDNYEETFADMLIDLSQHLVADAGFLRSVIAAPAAPPPPKTGG